MVDTIGCMGQLYLWILGKLYICGGGGGGVEYHGVRKLCTYLVVRMSCIA